MAASLLKTLRLLEAPRFAAGTCLLIAAFGCGFLPALTVLYFRAPLTYVLSAESPARFVMAYLLASSGVGFACAGLLFSSLRLASGPRLWILALTALVAATSLAYALVPALFWPWALWPLFKFYREGECSAGDNENPLARGVEP